jgi:ribosome-binding ATPase YchF (GTP1/OBG family)
MNLKRDMNFLTDKEVMYAANVDEEGLAEDNEYVKKLKEYAKERNRDVIKLCAQFEEDMIEMTEEEKQEFLADLGPLPAFNQSLATASFLFPVA